MSPDSDTVEIPGVGAVEVPAPAIGRDDFPNPFIPYQQLVLKVTVLENTMKLLEARLTALEEQSCQT